MSEGRTYNDACGMARALDRVGERWAMMIVRELLMGPKRFTDLRTGLPSASPNVLAQRLKELERDGVVAKRRLPPPAASQVYELTEWGRELEDVALALGRWGARAPLSPEGTTMSVDSFLISMQTLFDPARAAGIGFRAELRMGRERFRVAVDDGELRLERGEDPGADAIVTVEMMDLVPMMHGWAPFDASIVEGDVDGFRRFLTLFPLPEPAAA